jgi:predicted thioesterase
MLTRSESSVVAETLRVSLAAAAAEASAEFAQAFDAAAEALAVRVGEAREPHPVLPVVGSSVVRDLVVGSDDTAAAMGHPDPAVNVLGSPRISLWFEIVASGLLPEPTPDLTHVGVGILVHHLGKAEVGDKVTVKATVQAVSGRRVVFTCAATVRERLVASGTHQRVLLEGRS